MVNIGKFLDFKLQKLAKNGRKLAGTSGLSQILAKNFFYVIKPQIDDFIPKVRPQKNTPFFWGGGATVKCQLYGGLFNMLRQKSRRKGLFLVLFLLVESNITR